MLKSAPEAVDVQDLQFKLHCRIKIFDNPHGVNFAQHCSLVTCASRFGLIFLGTNSPNIQAIQLKEIESYEKADGDKSDYPRRNLSLPSTPTHLSVNCEHTILATIITKDNTPWALFYDVKSFYQQEITKIAEVRLSPTPGVTVTEINWNPALSSIFTACKSDGALGIYELKNPGVDINELPPAAGATCFCWSPKGKQIALGSRDGKITQLKPDLKAVKVINAPPLNEPYSLVSLQWVSNYEFIGVFQPLNPENPATFIVINAPKTGDPTYINYDDICFSNGTTRALQFYLILIPTWNILMAASANSMEVGILGNSGDGWTQWIAGDAARAELPLSAKHQETLPIGCALDIGRTQPLPWGESTLPPAPLLLLFSHHGTLCCFNVVNLKQGIPSVCTPPDSVKESSGLQHFVTPSNEQKVTLSIPSKDPPKPILQIPVPASSVEPPKVLSISSATANVVPNLFKTPPQVSTAQGLNLSKTQPVNLFGDQTVLTPITQPNKTQQSSLGPQYQSLFQALSTGNTKPQVTTPIFQLSTTSSPVRTISTTTLASNLPVNNLTKLSQPEPKEELTSTEVSTVDVLAEEEAENIFAQMIREESLFLESELKALLHQGHNLKVNLGSDEEKSKLIEDTRALDEFLKEVLEICVSQNAEVHTLKQNLLQSWAWYEEAMSRHLTSHDEYKMILLRALPLDSASEKQLADIQHTIYYLESQISQAHMALDEQWENFQDYCKKTHKIQIPTMEVIFQTMVKQNAILRKQRYILKDIASRIKHKARSTVGPSLLISIDDIKDLPDELKRLRMNEEDIYQIQYKQIANKMKKFTKQKANNLLSFLKERECVHVSVIKPQLTTSIIQTSPVSKLKMSTFTLPKTPVAESKKQLNFYQSTPLPTPLKTETAPSSTPIEGLQNFTLNFEAKHLNLNDKTFIPLSKNLIASSPNSAFVSTTFGSNTSTATVTPSTIKQSFMGISSTATNTSVVAKTAPSYVIATTVPEASQPILTISTTNAGKPFSFGASLSVATSASPQSKVPSSTSIFVSTPKTVTSVFNITSKPTSISATGFALTPTTKPILTATNLNTVSTKTSTPSIFGITAVPASASFSFATVSTASIFGATNQNASEATASPTATKPFVFSSKPMTTTQSVLNLTVSKPATTAPVSGQPIQFSIANTSVSTSKTASLAPSVSTSAFAVQTSKSSTAATSTTSIFGSNQSISSSITETTPTSTPQPIFSLSGVKPLIFSTVSTPTSSTLSSTISSAGSSSSVVTNSASSISTAATNTVSSTTTAVTSAANIFGSKISTSKSGIFGSVTLSSSATTSTTAVASTTGFSFGVTASSKPIPFGGTDSSTTKPPAFGSVSTTPSAVNVTPSLGGSASSSPKSSIFATSTAAGTAPTTAFVSPTVTTTSSIFGTVSSSTSGVFKSPTTPGQSSIFGSTPSTTATLSVLTSSAVQPSLFGATSSASSGFGSLSVSSSKPSVFSTASPTSTTFGTVASTQPSVFGTATTSSPSSIFRTVASTTSSSLFGAAPTTSSSSLFGTGTATSSPSLFGAGSTVSTASSIFGSSSANKSSVFGSAPTTTVQSIFGSTPVTTTTQSQGFGLFGNTTQKTSLFGTTPNTIQSSVFGSSNQTSVFGAPVSTSSSVFGQSQPNTFGQSVFGSSANTFGTSSTFGSSAPAFGSAGGSIFRSTQTTSGSIFGGASLPQTSSVFGTPASSASLPFGSGNIFASNTTQTNAFGTNTNTGSFGFGSLNVGSTATTSSSGFGSSPAANPFGGTNKFAFGSPSASSSSSIFGSNTSSPFGSSSQTFGSGFGNQSVFGQQSTFGQQSSFGSSTFGQATPGPFSGGTGGGVAQTGFGISSNFQKPGGFGGSPVFGGSPSFGSAPSFGGAPAFGSPSAFGSGSKPFGASAGFGSTSSSQTTGFDNLANQPTVGFGNLAQQAAEANPSTPFSGNSSFSSWR